MEIDSLMEKIESIFGEYGFKEETIGKKRYLVRDSCYCQITYLEKLQAFVIESADNIKDAFNGALEDGDLYYINVSEKEVLNQIRWVWR